MKILLTTALCALAIAAGAGVAVTNMPDKDAFVRALAPNDNYGGGGALSISGTNATTGNPTNGAFDSFISFNTQAMASNFNAAFGSSNWVISSATLVLTQNSSPGNPVFNYGTGAFEVRWIANDTWTEGTGTPNAPTTNGICYAQETNYLNPSIDTTLGAFNFAGTSPVTCPLALAAPFVTNMAAGGEVGLFLTAADASLGFVFYSRQFAGLSSTHPALIVSAMAQPAITALAVSGSDLLLSATNGVAGGTYYVLGSMDLSAPLNQWTPIATNVLTSGGNFTIDLTNAAGAGSAQYFLLQTY